MSLNSKVETILSKVDAILKRNMTIPPKEAPCYAKIMELKERVDYLESLTDGPDFGEQLEYLDRLKTYCHLLNLPEGNAMEEYEMLLKQKPFLENEISKHNKAQIVHPYGSAAYKKDETQGNRLRDMIFDMKRQLRFYGVFLSTPRNEIAAKWAPLIPASAAKAASAIPPTSSLLRPITGPTLPLFGKPSPFTEGGKRKRKQKQKQTKKVRKHRRRRTSRS